jgi:hypothetical protein
MSLYRCHIDPGWMMQDTGRGGHRSDAWMMDSGIMSWLEDELADRMS